jgi:hypothetical protein
MIEAEDVADLVEQDGKQINLAEGVAARLGYEPTVRECDSELAIFLWGRIHEPAVTRRGGVDDDLGTGGLA